MDGIRLAEDLTRIGTPRVLVLGDVILDRYVWGAVDRISPEAPIQVLRVTREEYRLGGAGNVANNLRALGAVAGVAGLCGQDGEGEILRNLLQERGIEAAALVVDPSRPTTLKTRHLAQNQQILRVDRERVAPVRPDQRPALLTALDRFVPQALVLSDYGKGVLTADILRAAVQWGRERGVPVLVDPKSPDFRRYAGATVVTPNRAEFERAWGRPVADAASFRAAAERLLRDLDLEALVVTLGPQGMRLFRRGGPDLEVRARARAVYDVTGAGDTVIAILAFALAGGLDLPRAVYLANAGAGLVVGRVGAATVTRSELREALLLPERPEGGKICRREEIAGLAERLRAAGKKIVLTNGCFDLLHAGHVEYLAFARSLGSVLIVGVNTDASVRRIKKGPGRPIVPLEERLRVLAALEAVDYVVPFDEDTPEALIREILPDVLVKGEDWKDKGVVGREVVEAHGGQVVLAPLRPGLSTSALIRRIVAAGEKPNDGGGEIHGV